MTKQWLKTIEELKQNTGKLRMDMDGQNGGGLHLGKIWKTSTHFFSNLYQFISKCHLLINSWKIILSCYVAVLLKMKDSSSANLTFRAHNKQNKTKLPKTA